MNRFSWVFLSIALIQPAFSYGPSDEDEDLSAYSDRRVEALGGFKFLSPAYGGYLVYGVKNELTDAQTRDLLINSGLVKEAPKVSQDQHFGRVVRVLLKDERLIEHQRANRELYSRSMSLERMLELVTGMTFTTETLENGDAVYRPRADVAEETVFNNMIATGLVAAMPYKLDRPLSDGYLVGVKLKAAAARPLSPESLEILNVVRHCQKELSEILLPYSAKIKSVTVADNVWTLQSQSGGYGLTPTKPIANLQITITESSRPGPTDSLIEYHYDCKVIRLDSSN
jgi:hypothetical protein